MSRAPGRNGYSGRIAAIVLVVAWIAWSFRDVFRSGPTPEAIATATAWLGAFLGVVATVYVIATFLRFPSWRREHAAARRGDAVVAFGTGRTRLLAAQFRGAGLARIPLYMTAVVDGTGVSLLGGSIRHPRTIISIRWPEIVSVSATEIEELGRLTRGVKVETQQRGIPTTLSLGVVGYGLAGLFPPPLRKLNALIDRISSFAPNRDERAGIS
jgi:hypothetical protein